MAKEINTQKPMRNLSVDLLKNAFDASRNPITISDCSLPDNPIIYANRAFSELTGYSLKDIIGNNCRFLQGKDVDPKVIATIRNAVHTGTTARVILKNYKKDGTPFWNDLVISPLEDSNGATTHFMGMQLDITDRITAEQTLIATTEELTNLNRELEHFTYAASHYVQKMRRTMRGYIQLLSKRYFSK